MAGMGAATHVGPADLDWLMVNFAHLWGLDEIGIYAIPVLLAIVALRWADKRARASVDQREEDQMSIGSRDPAGDS